MLVITRKIGQTVCIGNASVVVLPSRGEQVRLGIEAPKDVPIYRHEPTPWTEENDAIPTVWGKVDAA
jgi:carbon storage regulator